MKTNVRHVAILLPVRIFRFASPSSSRSAFAYQISSKPYHPRQSYDVTSIFQDGGQGIAILLSVSVSVISFIWEGQNPPAYQISARYLNPRLLLLSVSENKRPPCWNSTSGSDFNYVTIGMSFCICLYQISSKFSTQLECIQY